MSEPIDHLCPVCEAAPGVACTQDTIGPAVPHRLRAEIAAAAVNRAANTLAARRLAAWRREPWRCLGCAGENIQVRAMVLPGGAPGNVRRVSSAQWESRCADCGLAWTAVYTPERIDVHRTAIGFRFLAGDS